MLKKSCFVDKIFKLMYTQIVAWKNVVFCAFSRDNFAFAANSLIISAAACGGMEIDMESFSEIAICLENICKQITKIKRDKTAQFGLKNAHFSCMLHIDITPDGLTSTEISKACNVDKAFVSRTTTDLIKGGFICINEKFNDGRKYRNKYILTEKGEGVILDVKNALSEYFSELGGQLGKYETESFLKTVVAINGMIENQIEE